MLLQAATLKCSLHHVRPHTPASPVVRSLLNAKLSVPVLLDEATHALAWLAGLGLRPQSTRFGAYFRTMETYARLGDRTQRGAFIQRHSRLLLSSLIDFHDLVLLYQTFSGEQEHIVVSRLREAVRGPHLYPDERPETSSNRARNTAFELRLIARLTSAGKEVDNSTLSDLLVPHLGRNVHIECKRPHSLVALPGLAADAASQLRTRYATVAKLRGRGVIALDVSRACNPNMQIYFSNAQTEIDQILDQQHEEVASVLSQSSASPDSPRTLGTYLCNRQAFMLQHEDEADLVFSELLVLLPARSLNALDFSAFTAIAAQLRPPESAA